MVHHDIAIAALGALFGTAAPGSAIIVPTAGTTRRNQRRFAPPAAQLRLHDHRQRSECLEFGQRPELYHGENVYVSGSYGQNGVLYANRISVDGNNSGGYKNGGSRNVNTTDAR